MMQAVAANNRLDAEIIGSNPVYVLVIFPPGKSLYAPETLSTIAEVHKAVESQRDIGNVWSLESLRQWLAQEMGTTDVAALRQYVDELPLFLVRRFVNKDENTVIVLDEPSEEMENRARQDLTLVMDKGLSDLLPETRRALF